MDVRDVRERRMEELKDGMRKEERIEGCKD